MKRTLAWILGGATVSMLGVGATMVGCSSGGGGTDSGTPDVTTQDTGTPDVNKTETGPMDSGADCKDNPDLHPTEAGTIFCGYNDAGTGFSCSTGQQCCLGGSTGSDTYAPEGCYTWGGACPNPPPDGGAPIECEQTSDCYANTDGGTEAGLVCCLEGATAPAVVAGCQAGDLKSSDGKGIFCEQGSACTNSGALQICEQNSDCSGGKTCVPMRWKIYEIGFCM